MLKSVAVPKPLMYHSPDGTGRDTHAFNIHYDEHTRHMLHYKAEHLGALKTSLSPTKVYPHYKGVPNGEERIPFYFANGSGRDSYIF